MVDEDATFLKCFAFDDSDSDFSDAGNKLTKSFDSPGEQNDSVLPSPPPPPHYRRLLAATKSPAQNNTLEKDQNYRETFQQQNTGEAYADERAKTPLNFERINRAIEHSFSNHNIPMKETQVDPVQRDPHRVHSDWLSSGVSGGAVVSEDRQQRPATFLRERETGRGDSYSSSDISGAIERSAGAKYGNIQKNSSDARQLDATPQLPSTSSFATVTSPQTPLSTRGMPHDKRPYSRERMLQSIFGEDEDEESEEMESEPHAGRPPRGAGRHQDTPEQAPLLPPPDAGAGSRDTQRADNPPQKVGHVALNICTPQRHGAHTNIAGAERSDDNSPSYRAVYVANGEPMRGTRGLDHGRDEDQKRIRALEVEASKLRAQTQRDASQLREVSSKEMAMQAELARRNADIERLQRELKDLKVNEDAQLTQMHRELKRLRGEAEKIPLLKRELQQLTAAGDDQLQQMRRDINHLRADNDRLTEMTRELHQLRADNERMRLHERDFSRQQSDMHAELERCRGEVHRLQSILNAKTDQLKQTDLLLRDAQQQVSGMEAKMKRLDLELGAANEAARRASKGLHQHELDARQQDQSMHRLQQQQQATRVELRKAEVRAETAERELKAGEKETHRTQEQLRALKARCQQQDMQVRQLRATLQKHSNAGKSGGSPITTRVARSPPNRSAEARRQVGQISNERAFSPERYLADRLSYPRDGESFRRNHRDMLPPRLTDQRVT